jgi:vesicle coat complex subunit
MFLPHLIYTNVVPPPLIYRSLLFARTPQGKVAELRAELSAPSGKKDRNFMQKKIALKKIVANMTMSNNDMVALFPDIIEVMGLQSLEIKKMSVDEIYWVNGREG